VDTLFGEKPFRGLDIPAETTLTLDVRSLVTGCCCWFPRRPEWSLVVWFLFGTIVGIYPKASPLWSGHPLHHLHLSNWIPRATSYTDHKGIKPCFGHSQHLTYPKLKSAIINLVVKTGDCYGQPAIKNWWLTYRNCFVQQPSPRCQVVCWPMCWSTPGNKKSREDTVGEMWACGCASFLTCACCGWWSSE